MHLPAEGTHNVREFTSSSDLSGTITFYESGFSYSIQSTTPIYSEHWSAHLYEIVGPGNESTDYLINGQLPDSDSPMYSDGYGEHYQLIDLHSE